MKRHRAAGIGLAGHVQHEIGDRIELAEIDPEVPQLVRKAECKQLMCPLAHGTGGQEVRNVSHDLP